MTTTVEQTELLDVARTLRAAAVLLLDPDLSDVSWEDAVRVHHEVDMIRKTLAVAQGFLVEHVHDQWPGEWKTPLVVEGVGRVQVFRGKDRKKWDHEALTKAVVDAHLAETQGEIPDPFTVARWITAVATPAYWKTSGLKPLGIDVDEYCESVQGSRGLRITSNDTVTGGES